jgi:hypothetical protein
MQLAARKLGPIDFMSRHFVALIIPCETFNNDGSFYRVGALHFSGFVLALHGRLYWVTAGHCFRDTDKLIADGVVRVLEGGGFVDYLGYEATHRQPYPFSYVPNCGCYLYKPDLAIDCGLIPLDILQTRCFLANKVAPITRENWIHQHRLSFDFYKMLGVPEDGVLQEALPNGSIDIGVRPTMVAVNRLDPSEVDDGQAGWFVGQIDPGASELKTVKGMSGGPIYGFRRDDNGQLTYHVVALQSWWRDRSRTIFGCSFPMFAEQLHLAMQSDADGSGDS